MRFRRGFDESPVALENHLIPDALSAPIGASVFAGALSEDGSERFTFDDALQEVTFEARAKELHGHFTSVNMYPGAGGSLQQDFFEAYMRGDNIADLLGHKGSSNATEVFLHAVAANEYNVAKQISFLRHIGDNDLDASATLLTRDWRIDQADRFQEVLQDLHFENARMLVRHLFGESHRQIAESSYCLESSVATGIKVAATQVENGMGTRMLNLRTPRYFPTKRDAITNDLKPCMAKIEGGIARLPLLKRTAEGQQQNVQLLQLVAKRENSQGVIRSLARLTSRTAVRYVLKHGLD